MTNDLDYIIDNKQTVDVFLYFDLKEQEFRVKLYEIYPKDIRYIYIKRFEVVLDLPNKSLFNNDRIGYLYIERDKMWSDMREKDFDIDKTRDSQSTKNWKRHCIFRSSSRLNNFTNFSPMNTLQDPFIGA